MDLKMKKIIKMILIIFIVIFAIIQFLKWGIIKYGGTNLETQKFNMLLYGIEKPDPAEELISALQWFNNWDNLFLSDNFKNKYKNRKNIINDIDRASLLGGGRDYSYEDKYVAVVRALNKRSIKDILTNNHETITDEYYFECFTNGDGYLDDIKLIEHNVVDSATEIPIE